MGNRMNRFFLVTTAMVCLAAAGCSSTSEKLEHSEEVKNYRSKIDNFMKTYIQPEYEIPTVYAPQWKDNPDYNEIAALTKRTYQSLPLLTQGKKLKSLSLTYATANVKKSFIISAANEKNKISILCRDEDKVRDLFKAEAEMPEIITMPKGIPANLEDAVIRELYMIHSFLLNPDKLAKSISLDIIPMSDLKKKTTAFERKEYSVDKRLCYKIEIQLRDMFGAGLIHLYAEGDEVVRIEIPSLTLDASASSSFVLTIDSFQSIDGILVPASFVFRGERFLLKENQIAR